MEQPLLVNQNELFTILKKAFEKGKKEETTLNELVQEIEKDLKRLTTIKTEIG